ncbi:MAG TPA: glutamate formimidoyltransferase [Magnetospirillaceae bacterium]|nr:glutamate formimidoyltransferase [Magnetospirillaceae bacterium]
MAHDKIIECVPNFSEGRDRGVIDAISQAISGISGVRLLDVDPGADTNRTVYTFAGPPAEVADAALAAARAARELIDMRRHTGAHPRMGAMDVCPFVPVSGVSMEECADIARSVGRRLAGEIGVPVYLYESAASRPERKNLADIRSGEYESLPDKLRKPEWTPDFGPAEFDPRWGATVVGAREFLIAYNVNLNTRDRKLAHQIALNVREGGRAVKGPDGASLRDEKGELVKIPGRLSHVRAIGWYIDAYRRAQVSINLTDYRATPLHVVYETVRDEAEKLGIRVTGSEVVGLLPLEPLAEAGRFYLRKAGKSGGAPEAELLETAVQSLGLDSVSPFEAEKKVVEYAVRAAPPLASLRTSAFADQVSSDSPAPGGGSVAALAGCLGAALAAMVANLTVGRKGYEESWKALDDLAVRSQQVKSRLLAAVDEDTEAFNGVLAAMKLPKSTDGEKAVRAAAVQAGYRAATLVPLQTTKACLEAARACETAAALGNRASFTDAGVGVLMAAAGAEGAALNVLVNLGSIEVSDWAARTRTEALAFAAEARGVRDRVMARVDEVLKS